MIFSRRVFIFLLSGGVAALSNMGSRFLFSLVFSYPVAIALAYSVGMLVAFFMFKLLVFNGAGGRGPLREVFWYLVINAFALLQTLAVSVALADYILPFIGWTWRQHDIAHVIGVLFPVFSSYFGHKHLTFSKRRQCA